MPKFWTRLRTTGVPKIIEKSNLNFDKNQHQIDIIFLGIHKVCTPATGEGGLDKSVYLLF